MCVLQLVLIDITLKDRVKIYEKSVKKRILNFHSLMNH
jgi:hypothetical protein